MPLTITIQELPAQAILAVTRRIERPEIAAFLGGTFGRVAGFMQSAGAAIAGPPFARFLDMSGGALTIQAGWPVTVSTTANSGDIQPDTIPACTAAVTTYSGPYENLLGAHREVESWIKDQHLVPSGAPWETYITDPATVPDPADWKTEIFWPVTKAGA